MAKTIDLKKSVYQLTEEHPELVEILKDLGFLGLAHPLTRKTLGKVTTIPQGCRMQGKDLALIVDHLEAKGFHVEGRDCTGVNSGEDR